MSVQVGQAAPGFELTASSGELVSLEQFKGERSVVLLFVPLAFTPVCTNELSIMRDNYEEYRGLGAEVVAASVDSQYTLKVWSDQLKLPFPLLSDFNKEVATAYGAIYDSLMGLKGVAKRAAFVIDKQGIVRYRWVSEDSNVLPEFDEIQAALRVSEST